MAGENNNELKNNNNLNNNNQDDLEFGRMPCHHSPQRLAHMARTSTYVRETEMKIGLLQIIYVNRFAGLDQEDPYTHLTKFYELASTLGTSEVEEEVVFMRLFPHSMICKAKD